MVVDSLLFQLFVGGVFWFLLSNAVLSVFFQVLQSSRRGRENCCFTLVLFFQCKK